MAGDRSRTPQLDAAEWDRRYREKELVWSAGPNQFVAAEVGDLVPGRALDLGAGEGRNAIWLAERGWQVTAVDFSQAGLEKAAVLAAARQVRVELICADVADWQPPAAGYELVLLAYLQLPAGVIDGVLRAAVKALAPGGTLLIIGHDRDNLVRGHGGPQDPDVLYSAAGLAARLTELDIQRAEQVQRPVKVNGGAEVSAIDTLVRAVRPRSGQH